MDHGMEISAPSDPAGPVQPPGSTSVLSCLAVPKVELAVSVFAERHEQDARPLYRRQTEILAYEILPENCECLKENAKIWKNIEVYPFGLSLGDVSLFLYNNDEASC
jgi:hypothetical protein